jgi:long-chain acyl-CoA synthetase
MTDLPAGWPAVPLDVAHKLMMAPGSPFEVEDVVIRGVPMQAWKNLPRTLREVFQFARATWGPRTFLVYEAERVTYEAFARASITLAHELMAAGVVKGDRVAIAMRNLPEWAVAFYAIELAGAIATPLNAWWTGPELAFALNDSGSRVLVCDAERLGRLVPHFPDLPTLETA